MSEGSDLIWLIYRGRPHARKPAERGPFLLGYVLSEDKASATCASYAESAAKRLKGGMVKEYGSCGLVVCTPGQKEGYVHYEDVFEYHEVRLIQPA